MRISDWSSDVCSSDLMADGRTRAWAGEPRTRPTSTVCRSWWRHEDDRRLRASLRLAYALPARGPPTATPDGTGRRSTSHIARAHAFTPVTNARLVYRLMLVTKDQRAPRGQNAHKRAYTRTTTTKNTH